MLIGKIFLTSLRMTKKEAFELRTVTVSEKGQLAIPVDIRRRLNIRKGEKLLIAVQGRKILIEKSEDLSKRMGEDFKHLLALSERTAKKLWENESDAIWDKV